MSAVCDGGFAAIANFVEDFVAVLWNDVHIAVWLETIWQAFLPIPICLRIPCVGRDVPAECRVTSRAAA